MTKNGSESREVKVNELKGADSVESLMYRWINAYQNGLSARNVQFKVKEFNSKK